MTKHSQFLRWFLPALALWALGFAAAAVWDLSINITVYNPTGLFGVVMESFGWYPAFLPTLLLALLLMTQRGRPPRRRWQNLVAGLVAGAGFAAIYYASWEYLVGRGWLAHGADWRGWLWLAAGVAAAGVAVIGVWRVEGPLREKLTFFATWASVYMVANQVAVYLVKFIWARTRFDDMVAMGSFSHFTPWWRPFGYGGSSFPSGHTANAAGVFALLILCDLLPRWGRCRKLVTALCWAYIAAMATARICIGRHFLSDTLAASGLMALVFYGLHHCRRYQKGLRATLANTAHLPPGDRLIDESLDGTLEE